METVGGQRLKDLSVWIDFPALRSDLQRSMRAGLRTLLDYQRLAMLVAAVRATRKLHGDVIEFGTFQGGSAGVILQNLAADKTLHVFDSFEGMPDVAPEDNFHKKGDFAQTGAERVRSGLQKLGGRFKMHVGFFCETIPKLEEDASFRLSFAHIDADLYASVRESLEFCYPRMQQGAIIIFDDYGAPTCLGAKKAIDEFFSRRPEQVVRLSGDQHGCLVGGGNVYDTLIQQFAILKRVSGLRKAVFPA